MLVGGFVLLVKGADWFVDGASNIAAKFNISQLVIGLTVVAMGTSLPEAAISISASFKGSAGIAIGNIVGSNIMNIGLILGITAIIMPLAVQKTTRHYEIPMVIVVTILLAVLGLNDNMVTRAEGITLLIVFILYLIYTFRVAAVQLPEDTPENEAMEKNIVKVLAITVIGGVCIALGANFTVDGASALARFFGISEDIIGLTIVAFGTSLPELVTCVTAALKKEADIAVGNIVGSNLFNVLFVVGTAATIRPVAYGGEFFRDSIVCVAFPILLLLLLQNKEKSLLRWGGIVLLACYIAYFVLFNLSIINI
ncbi:MAG: calcium/sodium antiporter [Eubacterium sp.]|nr:calcium/sodium antiporter [Candidatus Colimonas fimequi]